VLMHGIAVALGLALALWVLILSIVLWWPEVTIVVLALLGRTMITILLLTLIGLLAVELRWFMR